jgi:hypothetical protein
MPNTESGIMITSYDRTNKLAMSHAVRVPLLGGSTMRLAQLRLSLMPLKAWSILESSGERERITSVPWAKGLLGGLLDGFLELFTSSHHTCHKLFWLSEAILPTGALLDILDILCGRF